MYSEALDILKDPKYDKLEIWLHDYDEECYKTKKDYTLNGLHWGYPDAVVYWVTNTILPGCDLVFTYAAFDTRKIASFRERYTGNSRYVKVPYKKVRKIIELGIRQKRDEAKLRIKKMEANNKIWEKEVKKMNFGKAALRIEFDKNKFTIKALKPQRIVAEGMGSALRNIKKGEVSVSPSAMKALNKIPDRRGLMALEFGLAGDISYLSRANIFTDIPVDNVSVSNENLEKLMKLVVVE